MKKAIFLGLFFGLAMLFVGFWLGFRASTPEVEVSVTFEETPQAQPETTARENLPKSTQTTKTISTQQQEEEETNRIEVVQSETQKKLAELGFSATKFHKISTKR